MSTQTDQKIKLVSQRAQHKAGGLYMSENGRFMVIQRRELLRCPKPHQFWGGFRQERCPGNREHFESWWQCFDLTTGLFFAEQHLRDVQARLNSGENALPKASVLYAVHTVYVSKKNGRGIRHVFGPMSRNEALKLKRRFRQEERDRPSPSYTFECRVHKLLPGN